MNDEIQAVILPMGHPVEPFGDLPKCVLVLGKPLEQIQEEALRNCGIERVQVADGPVLVIGDHTWFTSALIRAFLNQCSSDGGRLVVRGTFAEFTGPLQGLGDGDQIDLPVFFSPNGSKELDVLQGLPPVEVDLKVRVHQSPATHLAFKGVADQPIPVTDKMAHTIDHWTHVHRVNLLALMAHAERQRRQFVESWWWMKLWRFLCILGKARSLHGARIASALSQKGKGCKIHPTATVEASILGCGVEVGPYAVVQGSFLDDGAIIQEHAQVHLSVVGSSAVVGRGAMVRMSVLMERAMVSKSNGVQASVIGRDAFVAVGATLYDLSFGGPIKVMHRGQRVSSGLRFLGACLGHRSKIGPHVRIGYGESIPNDGFLVADPSSIVRNVGEMEAGEPYSLVDGTLHPIRKKPT